MRSKHSDSRQTPFHSWLFFGFAICMLIGESMKAEQPEVEPMRDGKMHVLMNALFERVEQSFRNASREVEQLVKAPSAKPANNDGVWAIVRTTDREIVRIDLFSPNGPARYATKRVYADSSFTKELQGGYDIRYDEGGKVVLFAKRPSAETLTFYPGGQVKEFAVQLAPGRYFEAAWTVQGKLVREGVRAGLTHPKSQE